MTFRYARHSNNLKKIEAFYTEVIGLEKLGGFENHDNYDGIFLGIPGSDWHLEFTTSSDMTKSTFDEDDILVFYLDSKEALENQKQRILNHKIQLETPKNPYWRANGMMISDPDAYKILFAIKK